MFDNSKPNIILLTDHSEPIFMQKLFGIARVASALRQAGYQVVVINHLHIWTPDELMTTLSHLISSQTLFVGFNSIFYRDLENVITRDDGGIEWPLCKPGSMLPHAHSLNQRVVQTIKTANPNCKIVLGGPDAADASWNKDYEYVVCGYADMSIVNLANHLLNGEKLNKSYRSINGFIIINDSKADGFDIATSRTSYETYDVVLPGETLPIEIARGCIFQCAFCSYPLNGKKKLDFIRSEEFLYNEFLENYEKYQVTRYIFSDDTFNDSVDKVQMMYNVSKRLPFKLEYWAYIRLDLISAHPETADLLLDSGMRGAFMGIESWNKTTGEIIGKGMAKEKQLATLRYLKGKWGNQIMLHGSFMVGLPEESIESVTDTFNTLMTDDCPLDSWIFRGFMLEDKAAKSNEFYSKITLDPKGYGYRILGKQDHLLAWENDYMDWKKATELANHFTLSGRTVRSVKIGGLGSFSIASLGFDLEFSTNKYVSDFDWNQVDMRKQQRATEYKHKFFKELRIPIDIERKE